MIALSYLQELKKKLDSFRPVPHSITKNLDEWYKVEFTYTSNAIEGNTLSRAETALVVEKGLTAEGKSIVEHLEAINHVKAWEYVQSLQSQKVPSVSEKNILTIHSHILHAIDDSNAGRYRSVPVRIAGSTVVMPNPLKVPFLMNEFITWLRTTKEHSVDIAIKAYFKFVSIHPFTDGNGRVGRLLMNLILIQGGYPPVIIRKEDRRKYIENIEKGQLTGDLSDYVSFMYQAIGDSLNIYLEAVSPKSCIVEDKPRQLLKIGELAKQTDETVPTIRFWTNEGLLPVEGYTQGGYQLYSPQIIERIKLIRKLQEQKRLTIAELKKAII
jgi:Fic family protein